LTGKETVCDPGDGAEITCASFAPDGASFATGGHDTTVVVWDATGRLGNTPDQSEFSPSNIDRLWADLGSLDLITWRRTYFTLAADPASALQVCRQRMRPAGEPDCSKLADFLARLDSNDFTGRSRATEAIRKMLADAGRAFVVEKALRHFLSTSPSLEARNR